MIVAVKHVREVFPHLLEQLPVRVREKDSAPSTSSNVAIGQDTALPIKEYENYPSSNTNFS